MNRYTKILNCIAIISTIGVAVISYYVLKGAISSDVLIIAQLIQIILSIILVLTCKKNK